MKVLAALLFSAALASKLSSSVPGGGEISRYMEFEGIKFKEMQAKAAQQQAEKDVAKLQTEYADLRTTAEDLKAKAELEKGKLDNLNIFMQHQEDHIFEANARLQVAKNKKMAAKNMQLDLAARVGMSQAAFDMAEAELKNQTHNLEDAKNAAIDANVTKSLLETMSSELQQAATQAQAEAYAAARTADKKLAEKQAHDAMAIKKDTEWQWKITLRDAKNQTNEVKDLNRTLLGAQRELEAWTQKQDTLKEKLLLLKEKKHKVTEKAARKQARYKKKKWNFIKAKRNATKVKFNFIALMQDMANGPINVVTKDKGKPTLKWGLSL